MAANHLKKHSPYKFRVKPLICTFELLNYFNCMPNLFVIIVEPAREENVGAAARAMKTMGFENLYLVNPKCKYLGEKSIATAHASRDILENASIFTSLQQAIEGMDLVIASTAKKRTVYEDNHAVEQLPSIILAKGDLLQKVAVVFGREESGLSNEELSLCHLFSSIPMVRPYPSLNLSQAIMVYCTYLSRFNFPHEKQATSMPPASELPVVRQKAQQILDDVGILPSNNIYARVMERLMMLDKDDTNLFHSFCKYYLMKYHGRKK